MYEYFIPLAYALPGLPAFESNLFAVATVLEFTQANEGLSNMADYASNGR